MQHFHLFSLKVITACHKETIGIQAVWTFILRIALRVENDGIAGEFRRQLAGTSCKGFDTRVSHFRRNPAGTGYFLATATSFVMMMEHITASSLLVFAQKIPPSQP
jgi:hypothetical protein